MDFIFANNASTRLAAALAALDTELEVTAGGGAAFPTPAYAEQFTITVKNIETGEQEIMYVQEKVYEDVWTVLRGQEGTAAIDFPANAAVAHQLTAAVLGYLRDLNDA